MQKPLQSLKTSQQVVFEIELRTHNFRNRDIRDFSFVFLCIPLLLSLVLFSFSFDVVPNDILSSLLQCCIIIKIFIFTVRKNSLQIQYLSQMHFAVQDERFIFNEWLKLKIFLFYSLLPRYLILHVFVYKQNFSK